jgi:hypothetical protein
MTSNDKRENLTIQKLYPGYTPEEQAEAEYALKRYVNLVWRIYQRLRRENPEYLTKELLNARFKRPRP